MGDLKKYGVIPLQHSVVAEEMVEYGSPKDKISSLEKSGSLIRLKNGLYVVSKSISNQNLSLELIANRLHGPSYVSFESALWYWGVIPERVYITKSATLKRAKNYTTPLGLFEYIKVPDVYFSIGLQHVVKEDAYAFIIARPEKAICDLILSTAGLRIQSLKAMREYLYEDLRIDDELTQSWDLKIIHECALNGYKKTELGLLYKLLSNG